MESPLAGIADDAQRVAEAIFTAFGIDAEVVDSSLRIVAGTGVYLERIGDFEEGGVGGGLYGRVLQSGVAEAALDTTDPFYDPIIEQGGVMLEQADFAAPIMLGGRPVGIVGLVAFTEEQAALLRPRSAAVLDFCERLAGLLASRLYYLEGVENLAQAHAELSLIQDSIDEGVLLVGPNGQLMVVSGPARDLTGYTGDQDTWDDLFAQALPAGTHRFRAHPRGRDPLLADARPLLADGTTLVVLRSAQAVQQLAYGLTNVRVPVPLSHLAGRSPHAERLRRDVARVALGEMPVLIWGEPGTGASAVAAALHDNGPRQDGPFIAVHISATAENTLEGAIFGRPEAEGGIGALALTARGSLLLDHVDHLPLRLQERLLATLRSGVLAEAENAQPLECRIIASTTTRLADAVRRGEFLGDLYTYLGQAVFHLTPLRQRKGDIPELCQTFLERLQSHTPEAPRILSAEAMRLLVSHSWPGNLRELGAVIEVAARRAQGIIEVRDLPERLHREPHLPSRPLDEMVQNFEASVILPLLRAYGSDTEGKRKVADHLGISLATLYRKLKNF